MKPRAGRTILIAALAAFATVASGADERPNRSAEKGAQASVRKAETMKIRLTIGDRVQTATLADNAAARDFASLLPLTLTLKDYASTEKVADLPRKLALEDVPKGYDPAVGDIAHFAPWGDLAIFYRDFGYSVGLVHLGTIEGSMDAFAGPGPLQVRIERVE
jgi:hypothetical protein